MQDNQWALTSLRRRWAGVVLLYAGGLWLGYHLLRLSWPEPLVRQWAVLALVVLAYGLWVGWTGLAKNHRPGESALFPTLGIGNTVSLLRGLTLGLLAGFLFLPRPEAGLLAWVPAILYTLLISLDYLDGYLARLTNRATLLGETLDGAFDALGMLVAVGLAVWYGQLPGWYLLIGLARYLFLVGSWWRTRQGKPVYDLPPSRNRRVLAGFQMGFISVILWPLFSPPETTLAGIIFAIPFLAGFGRDWLVVSGRLDPTSTSYDTVRERLVQVITGWLPLLLRLVVVIISIQFLLPAAIDVAVRRYLLAWPGAALPHLSADALGLLAILTTLMLALGILGRLAALGLLAPTAITVVVGGLQPQSVLLVVGTIALMLLGSGSFSLWQPEERWVRVRAGGRGDSSGC